MKRAGLIIITILLTQMLFIQTTAASQGVVVFVRVETPERTLAYGMVTASTFRDALDQLSLQEGFTLIYEQSASEWRVYGVEDSKSDETVTSVPVASDSPVTSVSSGSPVTPVASDSPVASIASDSPVASAASDSQAAPAASDSRVAPATSVVRDNEHQWLGYILRGGQVIRQEEFLSLSLAEGDEIVLYYGDPIDTAIVTHFTCEWDNGSLRFFVGAENTAWEEEDGTWVPYTVVNPMEGVTVHVAGSGGTLAVDTDEAGYAMIPAQQPGAAYFYAESAGNPPRIARTAPRWLTYGFGSDDQSAALNRSEAVAFMVNMYGIKKERPGEAPFSDVDEETTYNEEISTASEQGLVKGYDDGTFKPDMPMVLIQYGVLMSRLFPGTPDDTSSETEVPEWAAIAAGRMREAGLFAGVDARWMDAVTPEMLARMYINTKEWKR